MIGGGGNVAKFNYEFLSIPADPSCPAAVANSTLEVKSGAGAVVDGEILVCEGGKKQRSYQLSVFL